MTSSLARQAADAPAFVVEAWDELRPQAEAIVNALPGKPGTVLLCGCGDSHHASDSLSHAFRSWGQVSALGSPAMQTSRYLIPEFNRNPDQVLLIGISASGETARTLEALELGRERGLRTLAITAWPDSSLAQAADHILSFSMPQYELGPGLISYLGSLLSGFAVARQLAPERVRSAADQGIQAVSRGLASHLAEQLAVGAELAGQLSAGAPIQSAGEAGPQQLELGDHLPRLPITFLGSGPAYGSAMFAAAKLIEAAGWPAWAQDTEEWAHLEYFADPPELPLWLLSGAGRSLDRENEIEQAAQRIGRRLAVSRWPAGQLPAGWLSEALAPLSLWIGPVGLADTLRQRLAERPFRGFAGGRSLEQGGGANRIRSSRRIATLKEFDEFQPGN